MGDYIVFGQPSIGSDEIGEVVDSLNAKWLGTGPKVQLFEREFAQYKDVKPDQVAAVNSCTAALHLALIAAGVGPGDEVITTAMTFCATVNAIIHAGATPVLADIDNTGCIDVNSVESLITSKTKALLPVHYAGVPCDMDALMALAGKYRLKVVEDCAHAVEGSYKGKKLGTIGDFGCFSFYVTKNITTGEGGMILARCPDAIKRIKVLALHGMSADAWSRFSDSGYKTYDVVAAGFKYNMMDLQAALGIHQLRKVELMWQARKELFDWYSKELMGLPVSLPSLSPEDCRHSYHLYPLVLKPEASLSRSEVMIKLHEMGIGTGIHYTSLARSSYYQQRFSWSRSDVPNADSWGERTFSIPFSAEINDERRQRIRQSLIDVLS